MQRVDTLCCRDHAVQFLAMVLTVNARRFQRTLLLRGMWIGGQCLTQCVLAVVGSARTGLVLDAGFDREGTDLPTHASLATHDRHSLKHDDSILHTHRLCRTT